MFVQHILNTKNNANLITVPLKTDLSEAISILVAQKIGVVIVSETGQDALGILSERDIIRALSEAGTNDPKPERILYQRRLNNLCRATL